MNTVTHNPPEIIEQLEVWVRSLRSVCNRSDPDLRGLRAMVFLSLEFIREGHSGLEDVLAATRRLWNSLDPSVKEKVYGCSENSVLEGDCDPEPRIHWVAQLP